MMGRIMGLCRGGLREIIASPHPSPKERVAGARLKPHPSPLQRRGWLAHEESLTPALSKGEGGWRTKMLNEFRFE